VRERHRARLLSSVLRGSHNFRLFARNAARPTSFPDAADAAMRPVPRRSHGWHSRICGIPAPIQIQDPVQERLPPRAAPEARYVYRN
jgi:hypothetical protein